MGIDGLLLKVGRVADDPVALPGRRRAAPGLGQRQLGVAVDGEDRDRVAVAAVEAKSPPATSAVAQAVPEPVTTALPAVTETVPVT